MSPVARSVAETLLEASAVSRRFGRVIALEPIDLELRSGEAVALVGPNGAGKSTLMSILAGALRASEGRLVVTGSAKVGWLPQRPAHYGRLTALENLVLFARLEQMAEPEQEAARMLERFSLPSDRLSAYLSIGNRQRLSLAIALLGNPNVLLLDEPTASLDPRQRALLWREAQTHVAGGGAVLFSSQNPEEVERHATRVIALDSGRLVFGGTPEEYTVWEREP
ncbi:MAG: ABC transporter ATP-binding protein [Gaiellaceae bacterium]